MSTVVVGTIQSNSTSPPTFNNTNGTEIGTLCRAFCNFNGTSTVAIRASFNVSSITDNGTGDYTANFTTAMPDANYAVAGSANTGSSFTVAVVSRVLNTGSVRFVTTTSNTNTDFDIIGVAVFR
jgi:hypothetical protein